MRRLASAWLAALAGGLFVVACSDTPTPTQPQVQPLLSDQPSLLEVRTTGDSRYHMLPPHAGAWGLNQARGSRGGGGKRNQGTGINYHGGPVLHQTNVVAVYWSKSTIYNGGPTPGSSGSGAQDGSLVGYFLSNLGGSPYFNINTTYYDGAGAVQNSVTYTGYVALDESPSSNVSDGALRSRIASALSGGQLSYDANTLYAVFTGSGVNLGGGFGTQYCAYHGYFSWNGHVVKYAAMPYVAQYPSACTAQTTTPNGDFAADGVINVLAHETEETTTDPQLNAWYDTRGYENADKCAWNFGSTHVTNGAHWNETIGGKNFLIQQNWVNAGSGGCLQSY